MQKIHAYVNRIKELEDCKCSTASKRGKAWGVLQIGILSSLWKLNAVHETLTRFRENLSLKNQEEFKCLARFVQERFETILNFSKLWRLGEHDINAPTHPNRTPIA